MSVEKRLKQRESERMSDLSFRLMNLTFKVIDFFFRYIDRRVKTFGIQEGRRVGTLEDMGRDTGSFEVQAYLITPNLKTGLCLHRIDKCEYVLQGNITLHIVRRCEDVPSLFPSLQEAAGLMLYIRDRTVGKGPLR